MKNQNQPKAGLYIISPEKFVLNEFKQKLRQALKTGMVDVFQLRMKQATAAEIEQACLEIMPICHEYNVQFIVNDYVDIAAKIGADGVHLGIEDIDVKTARAKIGKNKIIGVSCYGDVDRAISLAEDGADYVAFGAFYPTTTKTPRARPEPEILKSWVSNSSVPCVAIGGIKPENAAPLIENGADFIAVVSYVWQHPDGPDVAVKELYARSR